MYTRGQSRVAEAQTENDNQPQLATTAKIAKLMQVVQQQAKLMQKQVEEYKKSLHAVKMICLRHLCRDF